MTFLSSPVNESQSSSPTVLTVAQLNGKIRGLIESEVGTVWVRGEISNFKAHSSGHFYFSLKDKDSHISAVMFRGLNSRLKFKLTDGLEVIARGKVSVYEPRGSYQIVCDMIEPVGAGALQKAFEQLKEKLKSEGLFEASRKRPIPSLPRHIAIITSPTGAAIRDMIQVLNRRNQLAQVTLIPANVQGAAAAPDLIAGLLKAFKLPEVDVIIIGRGGGSLEDLWAFNNEELARTISSSPIPVISAVGHEIDFTISDFVSDLRAPTPSAAAELAMRGTLEIKQQLSQYQQLLKVNIQKQIQWLGQKLKTANAKLQDPRRKIQDLILRQDELSGRLHRAVFRFFENKKLRLSVLSAKLAKPDQAIAKASMKLKNLNDRNQYLILEKLKKSRNDLRNKMLILDAVSPLKILERGFSITTLGEEIVKSSKQIKKNDKIKIKLNSGELVAVVEDVNVNEGKSV